MRDNDFMEEVNEDGSPLSSEQIAARKERDRFDPPIITGSINIISTGTIGGFKIEK